MDTEQEIMEMKKRLKKLEEKVKLQSNYSNKTPLWITFLVGFIAVFVVVYIFIGFISFMKF